MTIVRRTDNFLKWIKKNTIFNQEAFTLLDLYEIYINDICWGYEENDPEIPEEELIIRV